MGHMVDHFRDSRNMVGKIYTHWLIKILLS